MKEKMVEVIEMFEVSPMWGSKNVRVVKRKALRLGKTLFVKANKRQLEEICETPFAAVASRIEEVTEEISEQRLYEKVMKAEIQELKALEV